ncbi:MAG TPA: tetratricopeptide repeat protein [Flavobacteriales bacterium]|jgi:tetratricopeptide (TPR) repeat protein
MLSLFKSFLIAASLTFVALPSYSQTKEEQAESLTRSAIELMDNGHVDESIALIKKAQKLDPNNIIYPYELGYAYYLKKDYKSAIKVLSKLTNRPDTRDYVYQLLGNSYSMSGQPQKAIQVYEDGLKKFPLSGKLYLERGTMELKREDLDAALKYYEMGIKVDPNFPSNYYWASRIYSYTTETVWTLIYGELFMNLERNTKRTAEISKMLYDTYVESIQIDSDTSFNLKFSNVLKLEINEVNDVNNLKLPFPLMAYTPNMSVALINVKSINLESLHQIRSSFLRSYYENNTYVEYPNVLFDYQKRISEAGHLEAYNYWLLLRGDEEAFRLWYSTNEAKFDEFAEWFNSNALELSEEYRFYRTQY